MKSKLISLFCTLLFSQGMLAQSAEETSASAPASSPKSYPIMIDYAGNDEATIAIRNLNYKSATTLLNKQITAAKRKKESTSQLDKMLSACHHGENVLHGVDKLTIVDSVVVDKDKFLSAYPVSDDLGKLSLSENNELVQYQTQLNGMVLRPVSISDSTSTQLILQKCYLENGECVEASNVEGLEIEGDVNYPFLMPDGQTLYFAARSDEGLGNYDLYVTRYDSDSKQFYRADNMGFPYNSYANDYMLVIDEDKNLGWFASDRYQPNGKVCIYTFIPNESRKTIDYDAIEIETLILYASLRSINSVPYTAEEKAIRNKARSTALQMRHNVDVEEKHDFTFILNDSRNCYRLSDFTNVEARNQCQSWLQKCNNLQSLQKQLDSLRDNHNNSQNAQILNLETRIQELKAEISKLEKSIRKLELS